MHWWSLLALRRPIACLGAASCLLVLSAHIAAAQFYVRSPDVKKGVTALEEHGAFYSGPGDDERRRQSHEVELKHGLTDRWELILEGTFRQDIGESFEARRLELGAQCEIVERRGDGWGVAFRTLYEFALQDDIPDEILFGPLAKYVRGKDSFTINTFFVGQVGSEAEIGSAKITCGVGVGGLRVNSCRTLSKTTSMAVRKTDTRIFPPPGAPRAQVAER